MSSEPRFQDDKLYCTVRVGVSHMRPRRLPISSEESRLLPNEIRLKSKNSDIWRATPKRTPIVFGHFLLFRLETERNRAHEIVSIPSPQEVSKTDGKNTP